MQLLAGTDAGTRVRGHVRGGGNSAVQPPQYGRGDGGETTHTGTLLQDVNANVAPTL